MTGIQKDQDVFGHPYVSWSEREGGWLHQGVCRIVEGGPGKCMIVCETRIIGRAGFFARCATLIAALLGWFSEGKAFVERVRVPWDEIEGFALRTPEGPRTTRRVVAAVCRDGAVLALTRPVAAARAQALRERLALAFIGQGSDAAMRGRLETWMRT